MTKKAKNHLMTAIALLNGITESIQVVPDKYGDVAPEHSTASIMRRCIQARQEILMVQKSLKSGDST